MSFQPATEDDVPAIMRIERTPGYELFVGTYEADVHLTYMRSEAARYFVWREGGQVLGFVLFVRMGDPNRIVEAKRIALAQAGTGLGGRFVRAMMDWVFEQTDANRLELDCSMENPRALHVYEREGFVREGVVREVYRTPEGRYVSSALFSILRREWEALRGGRA
jgi:RimJ/RimL family protein N-acetyltransferase